MLTCSSNSYSAASLPNYLKKRQRNMGTHCTLIVISVSLSFSSGLISGNLLPQDKLDLLMEDHFATFITDHDLGLLKSAHIDTVRIPVTYSMFLPKENRTGNFPKGELRALDK